MESFNDVHLVFGGDRGLGGLRRNVLNRRIAKSTVAMKAALRYLRHPHAGAYHSGDELQEQLLLQARHWIATHPDDIDPDVLDVVAAGVLRSDIDASLRHRIFGGLPLEADLTPVAKRWLRDDGYRVTLEVDVGDSRADLVGHKEAFLERRLVIVELKNSPAEVERLEGQLADYRRGCDLLRVLLTPECLADVALDEDDLTDPLALADQVEHWGAELWLYDSTSEKFAQLSEGSPSYEQRRFNAIWNSVRSVEAA